MTYELFEKANELCADIEHYRSLLSLFTIYSRFDENEHQVILQRLDDPHDRTHFGTDKMYISSELARALYEVVYTEMEKLEKEFAKL